jgi:hypothetical protein
LILFSAFFNQAKEVIEMANMPRISLIAMALIAGAGGLSSAGAQQRNEAPSIYRTDSPPRYQEQIPVMPAPLPGPDSYAGSGSPPSQLPDAAAGSDGSPPERLLRIQNDQSIRYVSGGVGEGERAELNALSSQFNLRLLFARQGSGEYLSAVRVNIRDARNGMILSTESKGPWFFAQLAPGDYIVEASAPDQAQQQAQRQTAHVDDAHQSRLDFYWR